MDFKPHLSTPMLVDANSGMLSLTRDGGVDWPRTLRLAKQSSQQGVQQAIVSTPRPQLESILRRMPHLNGLLQQHQIPMQVTPMIELTLRSDLFDQVIYLSLVVGGVHRRFVFLRLESEVDLPLVPVLRTLQSMYLTTVLVAPERCKSFRRDDNHLQEILASNALIQLSASSLLDETDPDRIKWCQHVIRKGLVQFVASESGIHHDLPISLADAHEKIERWTDREWADQLCCHNPARMFRGEVVKPQVPKKKSFFRLSDAINYQPPNSVARNAHGF